ncbi:hypothetical protein SDC9_159285 [bioreactor metagenome]|uniref:Uncharacterized protein n=1 Tax=bioreactor metagenome TaxID=1076179 RepID=A0A645FEF4_9ZZZZ
MEHRRFPRGVQPAGVYPDAGRLGGELSLDGGSTAHGHHGAGESGVPGIYPGDPGGIRAGQLCADPVDQGQKRYSGAVGRAADAARTV